MATPENQAAARERKLAVWICCHCQAPRLAGHETCDRCGKRLHDSVEYVPLFQQPATSEHEHDINCPMWAMKCECVYSATGASEGVGDFTTWNRAITIVLRDFRDYCGIDSNDSEKVAAIISAHLSDAGEVERRDLDWALRELADGWIVNNKREGPHGFYRNARRVLESVIGDARANAIREAREKVQAMPAELFTADEITAVLQSLLDKKEGEDGRT